MKVAEFSDKTGIKEGVIVRKALDGELYRVVEIERSTTGGIAVSGRRAENPQASLTYLGNQHTEWTIVDGNCEVHDDQASIVADAATISDIATKDLADLQRENAALKKALAPFVEVAAWKLDFDLPRGITEDDTSPVWGGDEYEGKPCIYVGDLKAARSTYEQCSKE